MKPHESPPPPQIQKKSIRGDSGDTWPVWNRGIKYIFRIKFKIPILDLMLLPKTVFHLKGYITVTPNTIIFISSLYFLLTHHAEVNIAIVLKDGLEL